MISGNIQYEIGSKLEHAGSRLSWAVTGLCCMSGSGFGLPARVKLDLCKLLPCYNSKTFGVYKIQSDFSFHTYVASSTPVQRRSSLFILIF